VGQNRAIVAVFHSSPTYCHPIPSPFHRAIQRKELHRTIYNKELHRAIDSTINNPNAIGKAEAFAISLLALEKVLLQIISRTS
jgi:hypothetical protein